MFGKYHKIPITPRPSLPAAFQTRQNGCQMKIFSGKARVENVQLIHLKIIMQVLPMSDSRKTKQGNHIGHSDCSLSGRIQYDNLEYL